MKVVITKSNDSLNFYMIFKKMKLYLFSQQFTKGVYEYFKNGRSENEIRSFKNWGKNPRLDKTLSKIPMYKKFALKEAELEYA